MCIDYEPYGRWYYMHKKLRERYGNRLMDYHLAKEDLCKLIYERYESKSIIGKFIAFCRRKEYIDIIDATERPYSCIEHDRSMPATIANINIPATENNVRDKQLTQNFKKFIYHANEVESTHALMSVEIKDRRCRLAGRPRGTNIVDFVNAEPLRDIFARSLIVDAVLRYIDYE